MGRTTILMLALAGALVVASLAVSLKTRSATEKVIRVTAKKFEFSPGEITVKKGEPVVLELTTADRSHGFNLPDFGVRAEVKPGETTHLRITPDKTGKFTFACDVFCGSGHEDMSGVLVVTE